MRWACASTTSRYRLRISLVLACLWSDSPTSLLESLVSLLGSTAFHHEFPIPLVESPTSLLKSPTSLLNSPPSLLERLRPSDLMISLLSSFFVPPNDLGTGSRRSRGTADGDLLSLSRGKERELGAGSLLIRLRGWQVVDQDTPVKNNREGIKRFCLVSIMYIDMKNL